MTAKAVMDDIGEISIIIFEEGHYNRPVAILSTYEWSQMVNNITKELQTLKVYGEHRTRTLTMNKE